MLFQILVILDLKCKPSLKFLIINLYIIIHMLFKMIIFHYETPNLNNLLSKTQMLKSTQVTNSCKFGGYASYLYHQSIFTFEKNIIGVS